MSATKRSMSISHSIQCRKIKGKKIIFMLIQRCHELKQHLFCRELIKGQTRTISVVVVVVEFILFHKKFVNFGLIY